MNHQTHIVLLEDCKLYNASQTLKRGTIVEIRRVNLGMFGTRYAVIERRWLDGTVCVDYLPDSRVTGNISTVQRWRYASPIEVLAASASD